MYKHTGHLTKTFYGNDCYPIAIYGGNIMVRHKVTAHATLGITDTVQYRGRTDMADVYIKEAGRCVKKAREAFEATADGNKRETALEEEKQNSLLTIMFSAFALEAHINRIGHDRLDSKEWKKRKEWGIRQKWLDFPMLISSKSFDKNSQLYKDFDEIVKLRNYLVHFKDYKYKELAPHPCGNNVVGIYEHVNVKNAELAYTTANGMMEELATILKK